MPGYMFSRARFDEHIGRNGCPKLGYICNEMTAMGHRPKIGFGPHLNRSTSDSRHGHRARLTASEARVEAPGMVFFWQAPDRCGGGV